MEDVELSEGMKILVLRMNEMVQAKTENEALWARAIETEQKLQVEKEMMEKLDGSLDQFGVLKAY
ncbi:Hypothetical predicted protein [Olea europaea subsp. europaea]|uniref:Uncharacterized protein n=1 Tax=Olea europaea subsp. europaea TaxID=158383 RepID=A0A8S0SC70_OLEEU|nr:Hypothetical predicted protein [Olea europaea subsp. europaea]